MWEVYSVLWVTLQLIMLSNAILRYSGDSCESLIPIPQREDFSKFNLGPEFTQEELDMSEEETLDAPKELNARNPPFGLELDFNRYRKGKVYKVKIIAEGTYDSFMIQMVGRDKYNNKTFYGTWLEIPPIAKMISCDDTGYIQTTVIDKGRPVRLSNLTFTWRAPENDVGSIRAEASIAYNNFYHTFQSNNIPFEPFPVSMVDCGITKACTRLCPQKDFCSADNANYVVTFGMKDRSNQDEPEIEFKLGGNLARNKSDYVALGLGKSYYNLENMDIVVCSRDNNNVDIAHYFLEDKNSQPYEHRQNIRLIDSGIDTESGLSWCSFLRPQKPETELDLNLNDYLYHFYFRGKFNSNFKIILPPFDQIEKSSYQLNITDVYDTTHFPIESSSKSGGSNDLLIIDPWIFFYNGLFAFIGLQRINI